MDLVRLGSKYLPLLGGLLLLLISCSSSTGTTLRTDPVTLEPTAQVELTLLDLAERAWFIEKDPILTESYLDQIDKYTLLADNQRSLFQLLCRKVYTQILPLEGLGNNISSLYLDDDDLWMGTWGGGVYRYSIPLSHLTPFKQDRESLRVEILYDFERVGNQIHMAGYSDLYVYDRSNSHFSHIYPDKMERINNLEYYRGTLFASTIGMGLWYLDRLDRWTLFREEWKDKSINLLYENKDGQLLIGTASNGVLVYQGGDSFNLSEIYPNFTGININTISENDHFLLIGTYGEGFFIIEKRSKKVYHFSKEKGDFLSDYILCSAIKDDLIYLGSLGGGISVLSTQSLNDRAWVNLGMSEGLLSLDVVSLIIHNSQIYAANLGQGVIVFDEKIVKKTL